MTEKLQLYKCEICGNLVQVILNGTGELVCCNKKMVLQEPKEENSILGEHHKPIIDNTDSQITIEVKNHPMHKDHYIQFIEGIKRDKSELYLKYLKPDTEAKFDIDSNSANLETLDYCNVHGLWGDFSEG